MLEATRTRISFSGEIMTAAVFLAATVLVAALVVRELRVAAPREFSTAAEASSAAVPPDAVSVPTLMLGARGIKVGDPMAATLAQLDPAAVPIKNIVETGPLGARDVRSYELGGTRFILVAEPFERGGEPRVSAIYLR